MGHIVKSIMGSDRLGSGDRGEFRRVQLHNKEFKSMAVTQRFHQSVFGNQEETTSQFKSRSVGPKERIPYARQIHTQA